MAAGWCATLTRVLPRNFASTKAPTPPAELTPAVNMAAVEMHSGQIMVLLLPFYRWLLSRRLRRSFGVLLHALVDRSPTGAHALAVVVDDQSKRGVVKLDQ